MLHYKLDSRALSSKCLIYVTVILIKSEIMMGLFFLQNVLVVFNELHMIIIPGDRFDI